jgi:DNA helicase HerA-like ATPase
LGVGEALVSFLDDKGRPEMVERAFIIPPHSHIGPISAEQRTALIQGSVLQRHYGQEIDRESAYELLKVKAEQAALADRQAELAEEEQKAAEEVRREQARASRRESPMEAFIKSGARAVGGQLGRQIIRGVLGSIFGGTTRRRR